MGKVFDYGYELAKDYIDKSAPQPKCHRRCKKYLTPFRYHLKLFGLLIFCWVRFECQCSNGTMSGHYSGYKPKNVKWKV